MRMHCTGVFGRSPAPVGVVSMFFTTGRSALPTLFTLGNLVAGFAAIHYAAKPLDVGGPLIWTNLELTNLTFAGALVLLGIFFGYARLYGGLSLCILLHALHNSAVFLREIVAA